MSVFESLAVTPRSRGLHAPAGLARTAAPAAVLAAGLLLAVGVATAPRSGAPSLPFAIKPAPRPAMPPALYVPNTGQAPAGVLFERRGGGGMMPFSRGEAASGGVVMRFDGARATVRVAGTRRLGGVVNVLRGERSAWRTGLPIYAGVAYRGLYPGTDVRFGADGATWAVAAGADPARIGWHVPGAAPRVRPDGTLEVVPRGGGPAPGPPPPGGGARLGRARGGG